MMEMGADAACMHEMVPVAEGEVSAATLAEIATEFVMEPADAARMDMGECEESSEDESEDDEA